MELKEMNAFVLLIILVGMLLGVGIIILDNFGSAVPTISTANDSGIAVVNSTDTQELSYGNLTSTSPTVYNSTGGVLSSDLYTIAENTSNGNLAYFTLPTNSTAVHSTVDIVLEYNNYDTPTRDTVIGVRDEVGNISINWIGLIITVTILSLILLLVINSFGQR